MCSSENRVSPAKESRIGVTVLSGFLGSGKTSLLNRLVREPRYSRALVIINEFGEIGVDHALVQGLDDDVVLLAGGCICCSVRGALVDTLRDMFLRVVQRRIAPFDHVLIETTGVADVAPILFTLRHDFFLADRYMFEKCITVVDAGHIAGQLARHGVAASQIALADYVVINKIETMGAAQVEGLTEVVMAINPLAQVFAHQADADLPQALVAPQLSPRPAGLWSGKRLAGLNAGRHAGIAAFEVTYEGRWPRGRLMTALDDCLAAHGDDVLRVKGILYFQGLAHAEGAFALHAVHRVRYPLDLLAVRPGAQARCELVFIVSGDRAVIIEQSVRTRLAELIP